MDLKDTPSSAASIAAYYPTDPTRSEDQQPSSAHGRAEMPSSRNLNVVDWDGPDDLENPINWNSGRKATIVTLVSVITFLRCAALLGYPYELCFFLFFAINPANTR
jgi:hypothetical protein